MIGAYQLEEDQEDLYIEASSSEELRDTALEEESESNSEES